MTTTTHTNYTTTVAGMYEAFSRGDIDAVLAQLSDDVTWDATPEPWTPHAAGVPWLTPRRGPAEVRKFFEIVGQWKYENFDVLDMLVSDTQLAAIIRMTADLPNGHRLDEVVVHLWTFDADGKVIKLRRMLDTAANIAAASA
jgi:uncharacterized protein